MIYSGIFVHGVIFAFFFVGGQIFVDKKANKEIRAQAQGLLFLLSFGTGLLIGNFFNAELIARYTTVESVAGVDLKVYDWNSIWMITTVISALLLVAFIVLFRDENRKTQVTTSESAEQAPASQ
jgi:MFS family permease